MKHKYFKFLPVRTNRFNNRIGICYRSDAKTEAQIKAEKEKAEKEKKAQKDAVDAAALEFKSFEVKTPEDLQGKMEIMKKHLELKSAFEGYELKEQLDALKELTEQALTAKDDEIKALNEKTNALNATCEILGKRTSATNNAKTAKPTEEKTFNDILGETIDKFTKEIKSFKKGQQELTMRMVGFEDVPEGESGPEVKAVGVMNFAANFPSPTPFIQEVQNRLIETPYNRVWLSDLLPSGSSGGNSIIYPKENGGEGGAALWTDRTADKAQMDFDLTSQTAFFKWLAGWVEIDRDMLDDVSFLRSYLQSKMLISLKTAENAFILHGTTDANNVRGLMDAATTYNGTETRLVEQIIDGAWGQIVADTFDFYNPTTIVLHPRTAVAVGLNKATGSGEFDLPQGSVAFAQGKLQIGGLQVATTTQLSQGNFLAFDKNATILVRRMQPELRMFEDAVLAKKNRLMFRIEERLTLGIFNDAAIVTLNDAS